MDRRSVRKLTLSSVLASLQVVILYFSSMFSLLDLTFAAATVFVTMFAVSEIKGKWSFGIYLTVSVLSWVLLPSKFSAAVYTAFFGWYPILKVFAEKKLGKLAAFAVKLVSFNISFAAILAVCKYLLYMQDTMGFDPKVYYTVMFALGNIVFIMFDIMLTLAYTLYVLKLRKRIGAHKLFK